MDYKKRTREVYDKYSGVFEENSKGYLENHILRDAKMFILGLKEGRILDISSGPGRDSLFFKEQGLNPICFDFSFEMTKRCNERGLLAVQGDLENLSFGKESFDGVWAYTSLLHLPKKRLSLALENIFGILKPEGMFYMGMKEGNFEGFLKSEKYGEGERFFSLYSKEELDLKFSSRFELVCNSTVSLGDAIFLNYLGVKKS